MPETSSSQTITYTTVRQFKETYKVPVSTIYYMLNREYVKLKMVNTTYGKRKMFNEDEMKEKLRSRKLL